MTSEIRKKVEERVAAERRNDPVQEAAKYELSDWQIVRCAMEGDAGDAAVYIMVNRGKFLYVERLGVWLKWTGHYWQKDINAREATAAMDAVVDQYRRGYSALKKLLNDDEEPDRATLVHSSSIAAA